jgi:hypothetical protein
VNDGIGKFPGDWWNRGRCSPIVRSTAFEKLELHYSVNGPVNLGATLCGYAKVTGNGQSYFLQRGMSPSTGKRDKMPRLEEGPGGTLVLTGSTISADLVEGLGGPCNEQNKKWLPMHMFRFKITLHCAGF